MAERFRATRSTPDGCPLFHFFVVPVLLVNVIDGGVATDPVAPDSGRCGASSLRSRCSTLGFLSRIQALTVQDRVIRLEMRLRLRQLLPPDLQPRINDLTHRQLVALRFASDAELADLVREVLAGKLAAAKEIKMRVKNWQADWLRA